MKSIVDKYQKVCRIEMKYFCFYSLRRWFFVLRAMAKFRELKWWCIYLLCLVFTSNSFSLLFSVLPFSWNFVSSLFSFDSFKWPFFKNFCAFLWLAGFILALFLTVCHLFDLSPKDVRPFFLLLALCRHIVFPPTSISPVF